MARRRSFLKGLLAGATVPVLKPDMANIDKILDEPKPPAIKPVSVNTASTYFAPTAYLYTWVAPWPSATLDWGNE